MIPLVEAGKSLEIRDRWKVVDKMEMITQYTFAGDFTGTCRSPSFPGNSGLSALIAVEAIDKAVTEVAKFDAGETLSVACGTMLTVLQMTGSSLR